MLFESKFMASWFGTLSFLDSAIYMDASSSSLASCSVSLKLFSSESDDCDIPSSCCPNMEFCDTIYRLAGLAASSSDRESSPCYWNELDGS